LIYNEFELKLEEIGEREIIFRQNCFESVKPVSFYPYQLLQLFISVMTFWELIRDPCGGDRTIMMYHQYLLLLLGYSICPTGTEERYSHHTSESELNGKSRISDTGFQIKLHAQSRPNIGGICGLVHL
jgi:hypothetical protein